MCYFQREKDIEKLDIYALFNTDLCKEHGVMCNDRCHVILGMDTNDNVEDGSTSATLADIRITEAMINNHKGASVPVKYSKNTKRKPIDSI